jgi:trimeric autotransporter adhesin
MRRFVTLAVLLLFSIPFGVSISGCKKNAPPVFCDGGDSGVTTGQLTTIIINPKIHGISLNYAEIGQVNTPSGTDCKGNNVSQGAYTYGTTDMTIADIQPTTGRLCGGTWNRNTAGVPDYTYCNATNKTGIAYVSASAQGVASNPLPVYVHPVVTSIVLGSPATSGAATITAWSIASNVPTFAAQNTFAAGQAVSLSNFTNSTFFNGIANAVVQAAGLSSTQFSVSIPGFSQPNGSATETGLATGPGCTTNQSTDCCPLSTDTLTATPYSANACLSQGSTAQLVARVFAGTGSSQSNITCSTGYIPFSAQNGTVASIDPNGVVTALMPGSTLVTANVSNASSTAGFVSTCPPASISLSIPVATGSTNSISVNPNNTQPLTATVFDTNHVQLTGLTLEYLSTTPTTIPVGAGSVTPIFPGSASIYAICQPGSCNPSSYNQIGLFGNGKPVSSNSVTVTAPGTNSTVLYMGSTQSQYIVPIDFTTGVVGAPYRLPYVPNSMVMTQDGGTLYFGSATELMAVSAGTTLTLSREDTTSTGTVLAVSPDDSTIVIADPIRQLITLESSAGSVITTYGAACPLPTPPANSPILVPCRAQFTPDSQTLYIAANSTTSTSTKNAPQILVYSTNTGWTNTGPASPAVMPTDPTGTPLTTPVTDVAITVPGVGAYFAGTNTTAVGYCPSSTATSTAGSVTSEANAFYPPAEDTPTETATTDRIAATNDGLHILGATVSTAPATLNDLHVTIPTGACPMGTQTTVNGVTTGVTGGLVFSSTVSATKLSQIAATAITGVLPTSDSSIAFVTYTGSSGLLPAYAPLASGPGTMTYIPLFGGTTIAPIAGVPSADNSTFYVGTSGDNLVHIINRSTLTDCGFKAGGSCGLGTLVPSIVNPNLTNPAGTAVPVNLIAQKPRRST